MRGDILVITENHAKAARQAIGLMLAQLNASTGKFIITVAGESGSGKSETAASIAEQLATKGIKSFIFQQDDYFVYPPKTNAKMRTVNINQVGSSEVKIALLDQHLKSIIDGSVQLEKPLVYFDEDRIDKETINISDVKVIIVEGTYTTLLTHVHQHIFIDRDYKDTLESRKARNREKQDEFLEQILLIEHKIISAHKAKADIIITREYDAIKRR